MTKLKLYLVEYMDSPGCPEASTIIAEDREKVLSLISTNFRTYTESRGVLEDLGENEVIINEMVFETGIIYTGNYCC